VKEAKKASKSAENKQRLADEKAQKKLEAEAKKRATAEKIAATKRANKALAAAEQAAQWVRSSTQPDHEPTTIPPQKKSSIVITKAGTGEAVAVNQPEDVDMVQEDQERQSEQVDHPGTPLQHRVS
jgi:hypothetical protein